jgi:hypothetical protein
MLTGYKSYIIAAVGVAFAVVSYWSGTMDFDAAVAMALGAAGLGAIRHGISTTGGK